MIIHHVGYSRFIGFASCGVFTEDFKRTEVHEQVTCRNCKKMLEARKQEKKE